MPVAEGQLSTDLTLSNPANLRQALPKKMVGSGVTRRCGLRAKDILMTLCKLYIHRDTYRFYAHTTHLGEDK